MSKNFRFSLLLGSCTCVLLTAAMVAKGQQIDYRARQPINIPINNTDRPAPLARSGTQEQLSIGLFFPLNGGLRVADGVNVLYNNNYSAAVDANDAEQIANFEDDLSLKRENKFLSIEGRPLVDDKDTLFLNLFRMTIKSFEFHFTPTGFNAPNLQAYLQDNFTGTETRISLYANTTYAFSITSDALTSAAARFRVVFSTPEYISNGNVNFSSVDNWLSFNGASYIAATQVPTTLSSIAIKAGHTLTADQNFTINTAKRLYLEAGASMVIEPNRVLTINGVANFNGQALTIRSTTEGTGSIGTIPSPVSNHLLNATNATVERYVAALNKRSFRALGTVVNTTAANTKPYLKDNWQEGANNTSLTDNNSGLAGAGFGTHISGSTTGENGLDATLTGAPSLFTYDGNAYQSVTNTSSTLLNATTGYLMFVRGDRSDIRRLNASATSGNTTLRTTGTLLSGDIPYTLNTHSKFSLVTNPYASAIGWNTLFADVATTTNIENYYTYVDPNIADRGGYVTITNTGTSSHPTLNGTLNIQSGQAFFIKSTASGTHALTIKEAHKSTSNNVNVFRTGSQEQMSIALYFKMEDAVRMADGINILFNNKYAAAVDGNDAEQLTNFDEDISIIRESRFLSIEGRPLVDETDTIFLNMTHMEEQEYTLEFNPASFNAPGLQAWLYDNFLNTETPVSLNNQTTIPFTVSSNIASSANDRFMVVFRNITVLPINFTTVKAFEKGSNIQVEWNLGNEQNVKQYEIEKSADGRTFAKAGMLASRAISSTYNYQWLDVAPKSGNNYYRIKATENGGLYKYSQVVNVKTGKGSSLFVIYPNPVKDRIINLQLVNQPKGKYGIKLLNQLGQQVYHKELNHIGGSATETLVVDKGVGRGVYSLRITSGIFKTIQKLVIE